MEQTIKNMSVVIEKVSEELETGNSQPIKTLMNTYRTLCHVTYRKSYTNEITKEIVVELRRQDNELELILNKSNKLTSENLKQGKFKDADNFAEITRRIENVRLDIYHIVNRYSN